MCIQHKGKLYFKMCFFFFKNEEIVTHGLRRLFTSVFNSILLCFCLANIPILHMCAASWS